MSLTAKLHQARNIRYEYLMKFFFCVRLHKYSIYQKSSKYLVFCYLWPVIGIKMFACVKWCAALLLAAEFFVRMEEAFEFVGRERLVDSTLVLNVELI